MIGLFTKMPLRLPLRMFAGADDWDDPAYAHPAWAPESNTYVLIPDPPPPTEKSK